MTRISSLALAIACGGALLGFAVAGAAPVVLASEGKSALVPDVPRPSRAPAAIQQATSSPTPTPPQGASGAQEPRRTVRVVYVGPITAR